MNAPTFLRADAIFDPVGEIASAQRGMAASYTQRSWVEARCANASRNARDAPTARAPAGLPSGYCSETIKSVARFYILMLPSAVQAPCVADLGRVTFRKAFVAARDLFAKYGAAELYRRLLEILGSARLQRCVVEALLNECSTAFDRAVRVVRTPFFGVYDLQDVCRPWSSTEPVSWLKAASIRSQCTSSP